MKSVPLDKGNAGSGDEIALATEQNNERSREARK